MRLLLLIVAVLGCADGQTPAGGDGLGTMTSAAHCRVIRVPPSEYETIYETFSETVARWEAVCDGSTD